MKIRVIVDVFRAATTACYVLEQKPSSYSLMNKSSVAERLAHANSFAIGKAEIGATYSYQIPNSPTRVKEVKLKNLDVIHRTEAAARGVLEASEVDLVLLAGFVNAGATVDYIKKFSDREIEVIPMGHEGVTPSLEDDLCAQYIDALIHGKAFDLAPHEAELKDGPGKYFFGEDQQQYPSKDFNRCLKINRFNFAIIAAVKEDYAILSASEATLGFSSKS